jgi:glycosidase
MPTSRTCRDRSLAARLAATLLAAAAFSSLAPSAHAQINRPVTEDVFYHFMPIAWRDSNNDAFRYGDFGGMTASLDYLQNLGVTAIWMNPIYQSPAYHGYQHFAPTTTNPWFGTEAQFFAFVNAAHARGIKVFVDLVAYGVNRDDVYFQSANANPSSQYDSWLAFTNSGNTQYTGYTFNTWTNATVRFVNWDMRTAAMRTAMINWCRKWVDPNNDGNPSDGIDGFRLDHVWVQYNQGPDGWGYNLDDFWTPWHTSLRTLNPHFFSFVEQADWGSYGSEFLPQFNGALAKPMLFAIRDAVNAEQAANVKSSIQSTVSLLPSDAYATNRMFMASLGDHDVDRFTSVIGNGFGRAKVAAAILMTQPMTPMIYYGDEIGMLGRKGSFGSDADDIPMREPFKWKRIAGAPMSNYFAQHSGAFNARYSLDNDGRSVEEQEGVSGSLLETYRSLITIRKNSIALKRGRYIPIDANHGGLYACLRHADASITGGAPQSVLVVTNMTGGSVNTTINLGAMTLGNGAQSTLFGPSLAAITGANKSAFPVSLAAYTTSIITVDLTPPAEPVAPADIDGRNIPADAGVGSPTFGGPGTARSLQTCATGYGDNMSELNQLVLKATPSSSSGSLRLGITGNLEGNGNALVILLDITNGGQNILATQSVPAPPAAVSGLAGTTLDTGFAPDVMYHLNASGGGGLMYVDHVTLPTNGAQSTKTFRGSVSRSSGRGGLIGGVNPNNLYAAFDNTNNAGITSSAITNNASVTTGLEMLIPYTELFGSSGPSCGSISVMAFVCSPSGSLSNQVLPGVPFGTANLNATPNFQSITGVQYLTITIPAVADVDNGSNTGTRDGAVDINDLLYFLASFESGANAADLDDGSATGTTDGGVDINDLLFFLAHFEAGC